MLSRAVTWTMPALFLLATACGSDQSLASPSPKPIASVSDHGQFVGSNAHPIQIAKTGDYSVDWSVAADGHDNGPAEDWNHGHTGDLRPIATDCEYQIALHKEGSPSSEGVPVQIYSDGYWAADHPSGHAPVQLVAATYYLAIQMDTGHGPGGCSWTVTITPAT
jgi:hypothetical protein